MSRRSIVIWLLLVAATPAGRAAGQPLTPIAGRLDALIRPHAEADLLSGVVLVARGNEILAERVYGRADWELGVPNTRQTRFGVGSITKPMTEAVVAALVREGRVDLDSPVARYLPGFPRGPDDGAPTVGHLLTHRAGLPHRVTDAMEETQPLHAADIVERVKAAGLLFEPGSRRLYSSAGFTCLARVIEIVEEKPFDDVLAERVFEVAGMTRAMSETGQNLMPHRASPYRLGARDRRVVVKKAPYKDLRFLTGAGSVYATARDLLRFVQAVRAGRFGPGLQEELWSGEAGWHGWTGRTSGYEASVDVRPSENLVFVFLSNLRSPTNWQVREQIRNLLTGRPAAAIAVPPPVAESFEDPASLVGTYGPAEIALVDGHLFRGDSEIYPIEGRRYYSTASGAVMRFRRSADGTVNAIIAIGPNGEETVLPRSPR